jgi:hypothetical protein
MIVNPSHKEPVAPKENVRYPITVACVVADLSNYDNGIIQQVREHCSNQNIMFTTRVYNSSSYAVDRDVIERLPAFHIYTKGSYIKTFYPVGRPLQHINEVIDAYIQRQDAKVRRKAFWKNAYARLVAFVKKLGHRKTRLERYQEAQAVEEERRFARRHSSFESRGTATHEWS